MNNLHLLDRSEEFELALAGILGAAWWAALPAKPRHRASVLAARLSSEHARSARILLLQAMAPPSGVALLRLQFEALLRASWVLYCASDDQVGKLTAELTEESEQAAKNLPGPLDMLTRVVERTPVGLHDPLTQFHRSSWRALNSYVHAGIHPLARAGGGFPDALAQRLVCLSNGLVHLAYRIQASFLGQAHLDAVTRVWPDFLDALPPIAPTTDAP
jgi:hypothetical protein